MTAIKQTSVCSEKHLSRLKDYLSWDRDKALAHDTQNIISEERWFQEMADTRNAMGHDKPGEGGGEVHLHAASDTWFPPRRVRPQRREDDAGDVHAIRTRLRGRALSEPRGRHSSASRALPLRRHRPLCRAPRHQPQRP